MNIVLKYVLGFLGTILVVFILWYFKNIVAYILIAAVLAIIGRPLVDLLGRVKYKKFYLPKSIRALIALLFLWALFLSFFRVFIPIFVKEANDLSQINVRVFIDNLEEPVEKLESLIKTYSIKTEEDFSMQGYLTEKVYSFLNITAISNIFGSLAGFLGNIFIAIFAISFISFFFLKDQKLFIEGIMLFVPPKHEEAVGRALSSVKKLLTRYFIGICLQITCIITLVTIGLIIIGIGFQQAMLIALFVGIFNIIPYLGPVIGIIFGIFMGIATHIYLDFSTELLPMLAYMLIVFTVVQVIDNILFQPLIYSSSVNAHPLEIFLVLLIAGSLAGIPGMILAIPSYTILRVFSKEFFYNFKVVKKLTEKI